MKVIALFLLVFIGLGVSAQPQYILTGDFRTYPFTGAVQGEVNSSHLIWDGRAQSSFWHYGFVKPSLKLGSHGFAEVAVDVYPVSILQIGISRSITSRYYPTRGLDCDLAVCGGILTRGTFKTSLVLGYEKLIFIPGLSVVTMEHNDASKPLAIETENLLSAPGGDIVTIRGIFLGYDLKDYKVGLFNRSAQVRKTAQDNQVTYFIYSANYDNDWSYTAGVGQYQSDEFSAGISVFANLTYKLGTSLSLF